MGLFDWFRRSRQQEQQEQQVARLGGPGDFAISIVGESHYQEALSDVAGPKTERGHRREVEALLLHDDGNPHDKQAVAVTIEGAVVGYLERKLARQFRRRMKEAGAEGIPAVCRALIVGGWNRGDGDEGHYGVQLDLPHE